MPAKAPDSTPRKGPGKPVPKAASKAPSVVVFDFGGVLVDWNPRHLYRRLIADPAEMERFLGTVATTEWHVEQDRGGDPVEATRRLRAAYPEHADLIEAFYGRFDEMMAHDFPEMTALVERLDAAGVPLFLLSNAPAFLDDWARGPGRAMHPFLGRFRDYVVSGRVGLMKPDAAIYDLVCRTGGFAPADAVFIDDNLPNIEGARRAGLAAVHHRSPVETVAALRDLGLPA